MMYRNKKLIESAKHEECVSCGKPNSVWCHSDEYAHGQARGMKAHDLFGFYGCNMCHDFYDGRSNIEPPSFSSPYWHDAEEPKKQWFRVMWERSMKIICEKGYI